MHTTIEGKGKSLLLIHGIGSTGATWAGIAPLLAQDRRVIAIDLPGHGQTQADPDSCTFEGLAAGLERFLVEQDLAGVDMVGSSLGGRLVLEMARRGRAGAVVALDPGGFWMGWERTYLQMTLLASVTMLRGLGAARGPIAHNVATRSMLMVQLSAKPWALDGDMVQRELDSYARTETFSPLVNDLTVAPMQEGPAADSTRAMTIGWGRHDRLCWPVQARRALAAFPDARLHWFENSGHFPLWDEPEETVRIIRETIAA